MAFMYHQESRNISPRLPEEGQTEEEEEEEEDEEGDDEEEKPVHENLNDFELGALGLTPEGSQAFLSVSIRDSSLLGEEQLQKLQHVQRVHVANLNMGSFSALRSFRFLTHLDASGNKIASCRGLQNCSHLQSLILSNNLLQDVGPLICFPYLEVLDLQNNPLDPYKFQVALRSGCTFLKTLDVSGCPLALLPTLPPSLKILRAAHCNLATIPPLHNLKNLQYLNIKHNKIRNTDTCFSSVPRIGNEVFSRPFSQITSGTLGQISFSSSASSLALCSCCALPPCRPNTSNAAGLNPTKQTIPPATRTHQSRRLCWTATGSRRPHYQLDQQHNSRNFATSTEILADSSSNSSQTFTKSPNDDCDGIDGSSISCGHNDVSNSSTFSVVESMNTNTTCAGVDVDACEPNETCDICVGCFVPLLEEVDLSFNKICGVADLKQFRKASALWSLALAGNSVLHIQNFRSLLIKALPQLRYIDGRKLPLIEALADATLLGESSNGTASQIDTPWPNVDLDTE
eukprot:GHVT01040184.1.p1 GENE.GHVT01040184.1~~GHVT01040184.1.p1  ORF type:complete len:515 (-),score=62.09 GHVT01040184.1:978-2522(-)